MTGRACVLAGSVVARFRSGEGGMRWHPGFADGRLTQGGQRVAAAFDGGGQVAADDVSVLGSFFAGQPAGDVLLHLGRAQVAFGLVRGG